jgi:hypothetical protein
VETRSRGSRVRWLVGVVLGILVTVGIGIYALTVYLPQAVYSRVVAASKAAGIELQQCSGFDFTRDGLAITRVRLEQCTFQSSLPMQPAGTIERLDAELSNHTPTRVVIAGADVTVAGDLRALELYGELQAPTGVEVIAQRNRLRWLGAEGEKPRLIVENIQRLATDAPWSGDISVPDLVAGKFVFGEDLTLDLQHVTNPTSFLRLHVLPSRFTGTLSVNFDGLPMTLLSGMVFHNVPPELLTVQLTGQANFDLPFGLNPKQPKGHFKFTFQGLNFPVPREVAGLVYDTSPEVEGDVEINRTFNRFKIQNLTFATGRLRMKGNATVQREGTATHWLSSLRGPLPCEAIAAAAAKIHLQGLPLGPELASAAGRIGKKAIKGSVDILVALDAHSTDLAAAKIVKTIGVGCGLQPLPLLGAARNLLRDLPQLSLGSGSIADVIKDLPALPELPPLPKLPNRKKQTAPDQP